LSLLNDFFCLHTAALLKYKLSYYCWGMISGPLKLRSVSVSYANLVTDGGQSAYTHELRVDKQYQQVAFGKACYFARASDLTYHYHLKHRMNCTLAPLLM
jgi:hypothetical protein